MTKNRQVLGLTLLIAVQALCSVFFLSDALADVGDKGLAAMDVHMVVETIAVVGLILAIVFESKVLSAMLRRQAHMQRGLNIASGALHDLMEKYFADWGLTPSEHDVAAFAIKGSNIAEIAALRGSAEGTVKAHLNAIYRKAGVSGRGELVSLLIEDLMSAPLVGQGDAEAGAARAS